MEQRASLKKKGLKCLPPEKKKIVFQLHSFTGSVPTPNHFVPSLIAENIIIWALSHDSLTQAN